MLHAFFPKPMQMRECDCARYPSVSLKAMAIHGFSFRRGFCTFKGMNTLVKLLLLGLTLVVVFVNPAQLGVALYFSIFPMLFVLVFLFYRFSYAVSVADVRKIRTKEINLSFFCGMIPTQSEGDLTRGLLVIDRQNITLYQRVGKGRTKQTPCKEVWSMKVSDLTGFTLGKVLAFRNGITFNSKDGSVSFSSSKVKNLKPQVTSALGWPEEDQKL